MKIIHITDELQPDAGGLVSVPVNLAAAQAALGHDVALLGRTGKRKLSASGETRNIPYFDQVQVEDAQQPGLAAKVLPCRTLPLLKKYVSAGAVVHLHGTWDPILLLASKIARKTGATHIVTPHSMLHPWQMKRYVWQKKVVFAIGWKTMFNTAAFIHALTEAEKSYIERYHFIAPIEIIPNGIYLESFRAPHPNPFFQKHPELAQTPYILFLSRLHNQKGIVHLLDGFDLLAEQHATVRLVLAGPDYGELPVIREKMNSLKHADRILLPGPIYGEEKLGVLHGATCFALTSLNEGFSVAILEAMACGLPVVISENCYFPEVEKHNAGIICSLSADEIARAFLRLFRDEQLRQKMGKSAKKLVSENYTWSHIGEHTIELYKEHLHV